MVLITYPGAPAPVLPSSNLSVLRETFVGHESNIKAVFSPDDPPDKDYFRWGYHNYKMVKHVVRVLMIHHVDCLIFEQEEKETYMPVVVYSLASP